MRARLEDGVIRPWAEDSDPQRAWGLSEVTVREKLVAAGLPNLWIPKRVVRVEEIPQLKSGKLDLQGCRRIAEESGQRSPSR